MENPGIIHPGQQYKRLIREISKRKQIERQLGQLEDELNEQKQVRRQLHQLAYYDELTSLPNRVFFKEKLHESLMDDDAQAYVMTIDIDRFKKLNDTLGHENGNAALRVIGKRFSKQLPETVFLARYGGDEFSVIFEGKDDKLSMEIAQSILDSLLEPIVIVGNELSLTASVGLSHYPSRSKNIPQLLRHADTAMYQAKKQGGNRYCVWLPWRPAPESISPDTMGHSHPTAHTVHR